MLERFNNYINDKEFKLTVYDNKIHINNYQRIISLENDYVSLKSKTKKITIKGNNIHLKKLIDQELLLSGDINIIEVENVE